MKNIIKNYKTHRKTVLFNQDYITRQNKESEKLVHKYGFEKRDCPLCSSKKEIPMFKAPIYMFVQCNKCKLVYVNNLFNKKVLTDLYSGSKLRNEYWDFVENTHSKVRKHQYSNEISIILKHAPHKDKLIDIGCSRGLFLKRIDSQFKQIEGIEINPSSAKTAKNHVNIVHNKPIEELKLKPNSYDAAIAMNLIEHLYDPKSMLLQVRKILKKGGILFVQTPNLNSLSMKLFGNKNITIYDRFHINLFSKTTLKEIAEKCGFVTVVIESDNNLSFTISDLLYYYLNKHSFKHQGSPIKGFSFPSYIISSLISRFTKMTNLLKILNKGHSLNAVFRKV